MRLLAQLVPSQKLDSMPYLRGLGSNLHTLVFASALTAFSAVLFAVIPIARVPRLQTIKGLREATGRGSGLMWRRFGTSLVVVLRSPKWPSLTRVSRIGILSGRTRSGKNLLYYHWTSRPWKWVCDVGVPIRAVFRI
jgi:hypothetical protein